MFILFTHLFIFAVLRSNPKLKTSHTLVKLSINEGQPQPFLKFWFCDRVPLSCPAWFTLAIPHVWLLESLNYRCMSPHLAHIDHYREGLWLTCPWVYYYSAGIQSGVSWLLGTVSQMSSPSSPFLHLSFPSLCV